VIDNKGRLLVLEGADRQVSTFNDAALNRNVTPDFTLTVNLAAAPEGVAVDSKGTGHVCDATANAVFSYDSIATLNGALNADRTIQGVQTQLSNPRSIVILE
jgi:hypothetical protein